MDATRTDNGARPRILAETRSRFLSPAARDLWCDLNLADRCNRETAEFDDWIGGEPKRLRQALDELVGFGLARWHAGREGEVFDLAEHLLLPVTIDEVTIDGLLRVSPATEERLGAAYVGEAAEFAPVFGYAPDPEIPVEWLTAAVVNCERLAGSYNCLRHPRSGFLTEAEVAAMIEESSARLASRDEFERRLAAATEEEAK